MWLYNQRVIYICICLCSDNCFRTDQTRLGYYDVTDRLTLMIDLLSLFFINDLKDWFVSANYILWFTVGCRWSLFEIWRIECKQKGSKLNCYLVPPYISVKFNWGLGVSVVCTALRSDSDPCSRNNWFSEHIENCTENTIFSVFTEIWRILHWRKKMN